MLVASTFGSSPFSAGLHSLELTASTAILRRRRVSRPLIVAMAAAVDYTPPVAVKRWAVRPLTVAVVSALRGCKHLRAARGAGCAFAGTCVCKTGCRKRYCLCFKAGRACSAACKCGPRCANGVHACAAVTAAAGAGGVAGGVASVTI